jgi:hypothetical protein
LSGPAKWKVARRCGRAGSTVAGAEARIRQEWNRTIFEREKLIEHHSESIAEEKTSSKETVETIVKLGEFPVASVNYHGGVALAPLASAHIDLHQR